MSQKRKQRAAAPRDLSFGAVQRKLAEEGAAAAAASPRAKKKAAPLQIEKLIKKRRNPKNQSRWEVRARSPDRSPRLTCVMRSTWCAGAASIRPKTRGNPSTTCVSAPLPLRSRSAPARSPAANNSPFDAGSWESTVPSCGSG